jgi:hypothetical protein
MTRLTPISLEHRRQASELGRQMEQAETNTERLRLAHEAVRLLEVAKLEEVLNEQTQSAVVVP